MTRIGIALAALAASALVACGSEDKKDDGGNNPPPSSTFEIHYHRADAAYAGWTVEVTAGSAATTVASTETDGWGAVYTLELSEGATALTFSLKNGGATDPGGAHTVDVSGEARVAYVVHGSDIVVPRVPPAIPGPNQAALYYLRGDGDYAGWGLHTWGDQAVNTSWTIPLSSAGADAALGAGFLIDLPKSQPPQDCPSGRICFIVHKGDTKDPGPNNTDWDPAVLGNIAFVVTGSPSISALPRKLGGVEILGASAHLVRPELLFWDVTAPTAASYELRHSLTAAIQSTAEGDITGGEVIPLTPRTAAIPAEIQALAPHLEAMKAFDLDAPGAAQIPGALRGQVVVVARDAAGKALVATQVQAPFAIDHLWAYAGPLGPTWSGATPSLALWAPTAQEVTLKIHDADAARTELASVPLSRDAAGVWAHTGEPSWNGKLYRYVVKVYHWESKKVETLTVTDPYSVSLSTDSLYSQLVDLSDPTLAPAGWAALAKPPLAGFEDVVLYEGHIRDFSVGDLTVPEERRGKYLGFVTPAGGVQSDGLAHLEALADAGLTHLHLLPAFDIATVLEDPAQRADLDQQFAVLCARNPEVPAATCGQHAGKTVREVMALLAGNSEMQQQIAAWMAKYDGFNWGYDPLHYGVPEGSYASTAEGSARILEFREMVKGLAAVGLRVVMDVVYNHTNASGLSPKSVLDKVVPGYYHRRNVETGFVETSTCCANTATEHVMMRRLMKDTLVRWAREYKVDGFRFDLMGHHMKADMLEVRDALAALTLAGDGVDGSKIFLYGEGWDFGEVQNGFRGTNATQLNMGGTGIATFNDRLRDGARGGGPFDNNTVIRNKQGFASGLFLEPNETRLPADAEGDKDLLLQGTDWVKVGMAGNLKDFKLLDRFGTVKTGGQVGYNGARAGYTEDPQEAINYVSAHDNQTLFDIMQYKNPTSWSMADRVRAYNVTVDLVALGHGVPFFHMGDDILRSKSMERDSYDSGDWFNRIDWTLTTNGWKSGLPNAGKDQGNWLLIGNIFANPNIAPGPADIEAAASHFREILRVRKSTPLLRLGTRADVLARVDFLNGGTGQLPGVIVMTVTDGPCGGADLDPARDAVVVVVNADKVSRTVTVPGATGFVLHPVLAGSADPVVKTATATGDQFTVPARTTAVFQQNQGAARGEGLACNTR